MVIMRRLCARGVHTAALQRHAFNGRLALDQLAPQPLEELRRRSEARGLCDAAGRRLQGAPWGFQLAHGSSTPFPMLRTVGFQQVSSEGFSFLLRRRPDTERELPISALYVEGLYQSGDVCEQWRCEGVARAQSAATALATAPQTSLAALLAVSKRHCGADQMNGRVVMGEADRDELLHEAADQKRRLRAGHVSATEVEESVAMYAVSPVRVELLVGSPDHGAWERAEWTRDVESGLWQPPHRLSPY